MKKTILMMLFALLGMTQMVAQEYEYIPFVREGIKWVCYYDNIGQFPSYDQYYSEGLNFFTLEIKGDTIINNKAYKAMHKYSGASIDTRNDTIPVFLREEDKIIYGIVPKTNFYPDILIGYGDELGMQPNMYQIVRSGDEFILYNFKNTKQYYDSIFARHINYNYEYISSEYFVLNNEPVLCHHLMLILKDCYLIEGVGYDTDDIHIAGYPLFYMASERSNPPTFFLSHVIKDGKIIYKGMRYREGAYDGINEVVADQRRVHDGNYYDLMGRAVGKEVPTVPGIYIHQGKKICVKRN